MWSDTLAGKVLIASPSIGDPRFARSVIYLCAHTDEHAMGFVLNKPKGALKLPDLLTQLGIECTIEVPARPVLDGGPCDQERGFVLHSDDYQSRDATLEVGEGLRLTATRDVLEAIAHDHGPRRSARTGIAGERLARWRTGLRPAVRTGQCLQMDPRARPDRGRSRPAFGGGGPRLTPPGPKRSGAIWAR
jgi:putative AlgH/UPF0301 family transcriptional regulator